MRGQLDEIMHNRKLEPWNLNGQPLTVWMIEVWYTCVCYIQRSVLFIRSEVRLHDALVRLFQIFWTFLPIYHASPAILALVVVNIKLIWLLFFFTRRKFIVPFSWMTELGAPVFNFFHCPCSGISIKCIIKHIFLVCGFPFQLVFVAISFLMKSQNWKLLHFLYGMGFVFLRWYKKYGIL